MQGDLIEIWKPVVGYEELYEVSNLGNVRSFDRIINRPIGAYLKKGRVLRAGKSRNGYLTVRLVGNEGTSTINVHRLVAQAFLDNPNGYNEVNHLDEDKTNNKANNLEWCTHKYNMNYGTRNKRISSRRNGGKE